MDKKRIYIIKSAKCSALDEQLKWASETLSEKTRYLFNRDCKSLREGQIYDCCFVDAYGYKKIKKVAIMKKSGEYESNVLVCPIIEDNGLNFNGIHIGKIPILNVSKNYVAEIHRMQKVNKSAIKLAYNQKLTDIVPYGSISRFQFLSILNCYKSFLEEIIRENSKNEFVAENPQVCMTC